MEFEVRKNIPLDPLENVVFSSVRYVMDNVVFFLAKRQSGPLVGDLSVNEFRELLSSTLGGSVPVPTVSSANVSISDPAVITAVSPIAVGIANPLGVGATLPSVVSAMSPAAVPAVSPCSPVVILSSETDVVASSSSAGVVGSSPDVLLGEKSRCQKRESSGK